MFNLQLLIFRQFTFLKIRKKKYKKCLKKKVNFEIKFTLKLKVRCEVNNTHARVRVCIFFLQVTRTRETFQKRFFTIERSNASIIKHCHSVFYSKLYDKTKGKFNKIFKIIVFKKGFIQTACLLLLTFAIFSPLYWST